MSKDQKKLILKHRWDKIVFFICLTVSILIGIAGYYAPPKGEINSSVLTFIAELGGMAAMAFAAKAIESGRRAKYTHGDTVIEVSGAEAAEK